jgi:diphosphomevalonate decarboxylase
MPIQKATAEAKSNIAFIKYWGNREAARRLPLNDSISMNLDQMTTTTTVEFAAELGDDQIVISGAEAQGAARARVVAHLDRVRALASEIIFGRCLSCSAIMSHRRDGHRQNNAGDRLEL